jgi:sugar (pentulose or hexulose) kinase
MAVLIGVDAGTQNIKAIAVDECGRVFATST